MQMTKFQPRRSSSRTTTMMVIVAGILLMGGMIATILHLDEQSGGGTTAAATTTPSTSSSTSSSSLKLALRATGGKDAAAKGTTKQQRQLPEERRSPNVNSVMDYINQLNAEEQQGRQGSEGEDAEEELEEDGVEINEEDDDRLLQTPTNNNLTIPENITTTLVEEDEEEEATTTLKPTSSPTESTLEPTLAPTVVPSPSPTSQPTKEPTPQPTNSNIEPFGPIDYVGNDATGFYAPFPLGVCQGDCDSDADCDTSQGLYCFQRNAYQEVPGCTWGPMGEGRTTTSDFCAWNATSGKNKPVYPPPKYNFGSFEYVGNDGTWYSPYPLGPCKGDCDNDDDCAPGLFCYNRNPYTPIPGCTGGKEDDTTADVCVWNASLTDLLPQPPPEPPQEAFRLKLYWEEGYMWQNETFEREWCMSYNFDGYPGTGGCWYAREFMNCTMDQVYVALCIDDDPRQWFTFVDLGTEFNNDGVNEVMIKTVGDEPLTQWKKARCFERRQSQLYLTYNCNRNNPNQRFFAVGGSLTGYRFELGQYSGYTLDNCVANAHHPKSGEVVEFHVCEEARKEHDQTSFWEKFPPQSSGFHELVTQAQKRKSLPIVP